jgi:hypothetical protein
MPAAPSLGAVREPLVTKHFPLAKRDDDPVIELDICAACPAAHDIPLMDQDLVGPGIHGLGVERVALLQSSTSARREKPKPAFALRARRNRAPAPRLTDRSVSEQVSA